MNLWQSFFNNIIIKNNDVFKKKINQYNTHDSNLLKSSQNTIANLYFYVYLY